MLKSTFTKRVGILLAGGIVLGGCGGSPEKAVTQSEIEFAAPQSGEHDAFLDAWAKQALLTRSPTELLEKDYVVTSSDIPLAALRFNSIDISDPNKKCAKYSATGSHDLYLDTEAQKKQRAVCIPR